jgi:hypothetical protein
VLFIASEVIVVALSYNNAAFIISSEQRTTQIYDYLHKLYFEMLEIHMFEFLLCTNDQPTFKPEVPFCKQFF